MMTWVIQMEKDNYRVPSVPRTFEQVASQIVQYIADEHLQKGDRLPPERKMCELLQVSRSSVREGIRGLELLQYLESRHGGGTYVAETPPYLLPPRLLNQRIDEAHLDHYFEVGLAIAEKIVFLSLGAPGDPEPFREKTFWDGFAAFISHLGSRLENSHFVTLWADTYALLETNHFFTNRRNPFPLKDFLDSFLDEDRTELEIFFSRINKRKENL